MTVDLRSTLRLVRAPAALSVPGDSLAGAAAAGWPFGAVTPALAVSSACLYWAGMALNDYADRDVDALERPSRPIPSGRVSPRFALGVSAALTAGGLVVAGLAGRRALAVATPLAATVWAYDLCLKNTPAGPAAMAAARSLDVLLGAGVGRTRAAAPPAAAIGVHTLAVTALSRSEVTGAGPRLPRTTLAVTMAVVAGAGLAGRGSSAHRGLGWAPLAIYAATFGRAQLDAARDPGPAGLQRAVAAGILAMMPLQAALATGAGAPGVGACVLGAFPLARRLAARVTPT